MSISKAASENLRLVIDDIAENVPDDFQPMEFRLGKLSALVTNDTALDLNIPLKRMFNYQIALTFVPTAFLLTIACATLFIDPAHFEVTVGLSLTTMLVMQTLQENISDDLPKTAFLKFIDFWLLFGMMVPFVVFLVLCILEALPSAKETSLRNFGSDITTVKSGATGKVRLNTRRPVTKEKVHSWFKRSIPCFVSIFSLAYCALACYIANDHSFEFPT